MNVFYVYYHRDPETRVVKYVGKGSGNRAWAVTDRSRSHREWLKALLRKGVNLQDIIEIVVQNLSQDDAFDLERKHIAEQRPCFNVATAGAIAQESVELWKAWRQEGLTYQEIADRTGSISAHTVKRAIGDGKRAGCNASTEFSEQELEEMRMLRVTGWSYDRIALLKNVNKSQVYSAVNDGNVARNKVKFTAEDDDYIVTAREMGATFDQIAARFKCSGEPVRLRYHKLTLGVHHRAMN